MNRKHIELSQKLEKSTDLSRDEFISINHELSAIVDKYECYKKYLVCTVVKIHGIENYKGNCRSKRIVTR